MLPNTKRGKGYIRHGTAENAEGFLQEALCSDQIAYLVSVDVIVESFVKSDSYPIGTSLVIRPGNSYLRKIVHLVAKRWGCTSISTPMRDGGWWDYQCYSKCCAKHAPSPPLPWQFEGWHSIKRKQIRVTKCAESSSVSPVPLESLIPEERKSMGSSQRAKKTGSLDPRALVNSPILQLPKDVACYLFGMLTEVKDLLVVGSVCKKWYSYSLERLLWQAHIVRYVPNGIMLMNKMAISDPNHQRNWKQIYVQMMRAVHEAHPRPGSGMPSILHTTYTPAEALERLRTRVTSGLWQPVNVLVDWGSTAKPVKPHDENAWKFQFM